MGRGTLSLVLVGLAGLTLSACGGGGGGGGGGEAAAPPPFSGYYWVGSIGGFAPIGPPSAVTSTFGPLETAPGNSLELTLWNNASGHVGPGLQTSDHTYALTTGGALTWGMPSNFGPVSWLAGGVSRGGGLAVLGSILTGTDPQLALLVRRRGTFTASELAGTWHTVEWAHDPVNDRDAGAVGDVVLNADTTWSSNLTTYTPAGSSVGGLLGTFELWGDGTFGLLSGGIGWQGGVLEGGQVAFVSGAGAENGHPALKVLVREAAGTTTSTLSGDYWVGAFEGGSFGYRSATGTA